LIELLALRDAGNGAYLQTLEGQGRFGIFDAGKLEIIAWRETSNIQKKCETPQYHTYGLNFMEHGSPAMVRT